MWIMAPTPTLPHQIPWREESVLEQELARPKSVTFWGLLKHTQRVLEVVRFQQN